MVDMVAINEELPSQTVDGVVTETPTWNNVVALTGGLVGTATFPETGPPTRKDGVLLFNEAFCSGTINLKFSIAGESAEAGEVGYKQIEKRGLQVLHGC